MKAIIIILSIILITAFGQNIANEIIRENMQYRHFIVCIVGILLSLGTAYIILLITGKMDIDL